MKLLLIGAAIVAFLLAASSFFIPAVPAIPLVGLGLALWAVSTFAPPGTAAP